jgi:hypothetical protein
MFGQLLRRMTDANEGARFAAVVPEGVLPAVLRVAESVRERLGIEVFQVDDCGSVRRYEPAGSPGRANRPTSRGVRAPHVAGISGARATGKRNPSRPRLPSWQPRAFVPP